MPELSSEVTRAKQNLSTAGSAYSGLVGGQYTIEDELKKRANEAYNYNKDIVGPLDTATAEYYTAPKVAREKYQDIWNPFSRESLVSQYTANQAIPMLSYGNIYGSRRGSIADIIGAGTGAYNAQVAAALANYNAAQQAYENAINEYQLAEDARRWGAQQAGQASLLEQILASQRDQGQPQPTGGEDPEFVEEGTGPTGGAGTKPANIADIGNAILQSRNLPPVISGSSFSPWEWAGNTTRDLLFKLLGFKRIQ